MKVARVTLKSDSPLSWGRYHQTPKLEREIAEDYEKRTWKEKFHSLPDGRVTIPPMALRNTVMEAAKFMGKQIPGKGKSTYTKHFEAGFFCMEGIVLPQLKDDLEGMWLLVPASGVPGDGKRVSKCFPVIQQWEGTVTYFVVDEILTPSVFEEHIVAAGKFIGIGALRVRNRGYFGRFSLQDIQWTEE